ncbi:MAG: right-handed parallel beta-helix repeat-containing protein, partial [Thermoplasmatales archaeon]|nr:right-handed parallel beta-helix repeat-containing protein [Thermoplasmatales archaeon]
MKKVLAIGIMLLFIGMTISSATEINLEKQSTRTTLDGNILYVGGNGTGNYSSIQEAIENASDGDTVFVYNGTYFENLFVDKSINLIGESKNTTIIDGSDKETVVILSIYEGSLSDFTIQNGDYGIVLISSWKFYITNNLITGNRIGIKLDDSVRNIISNNTIEYNSGGIFLWHSSNNNT